MRNGGKQVTEDDPSTWMLSHQVAQALGAHRNNDLRVMVNNTLVPVAGVAYHGLADAMVIDLAESEELRIAMAPLSPAPENSDAHWYLSTGCLHGEHLYCSSTVTSDGAAKVPATCKFCGAACRCACHRAA
jgi:hypothetical protein